MVPVNLPCLSGWAVGTAACMLLAACSTHVSPSSVRDLERQGVAATERHRSKTSQATASLVHQPDGRQVVVISYPASVVPPPLQVVDTKAATAPLTGHAQTPLVSQAIAPARNAVAASALPKSRVVPAISPEQSARDMLEAWGGAWARGDADAYFRFYGPEVKGKASSRAAWEKQRRARLANSGIVVRFDNIRIETTNDHADVKLVQYYTAERHADIGEKHLKLKRLNGAWRIIAEDWAPVSVSKMKAAK